MKLSLSLLLSFLFVSFEVFGQNYEKYTWALNSKMVELTKEEAALPELNILKHVQYEYIYEEDGSPVIFVTRHEVVKVNTDDALAANNRIYISMNNVIEVKEVKARTINPDGRVIEIDQNDIKEIKDEEEGAGYKIFAIDGAEVGSQIEYYYTSKVGPSFFGREYFQFDSPVKRASFKLIAPVNLQFEFKSYKGFEEVIYNDSIKEKNVYSALSEDVTELKPEAFSIYNENRKRVEFKLTYNSSNGFVKLFTWENAGKNLYEQMHNLDKKEIKQVEKIFKDSKSGQFSTNFMRAAAIEDYVKTEFYIDENASGQSVNIEFIARNKFTSKYGITRLMVALLEQANVPIELVLTSDRTNVKMDGEFESYNYLEDYLIYLPEETKYIAPYNNQYRLDMTPPQYTGNQGLFVTTMVVRDYIHPVSEIKYIETAKAEDNFDNMLITVDFDENLSSNNITLERSFKGYQASYIKAILPLMEEAKKEELLKDLVKFMAQDSDIKEMKFEKTEFDFTTYKDPIDIKSVFLTPAFVERAGPTLLFKVGELIGPQSELYQDTKRNLPVVNDYNRSYNRRIKLQIPDGYTIQNLEDISIDESATNDAGKIIYHFKSGYKVEGRNLVVEITESYDEVYYPLEKFEDFRKVINAAADFNKIVLVMKKS